MDPAANLMCGTTIGTLILPAWVVLRLPKPAVSLPLGALISWTWSFLPGDLLRTLDPSYDSWGPAFNFLFGLPVSFGYCCIWMAVRAYALRKKKRRSGSIPDLVIWSGVALLCASFPLLVDAKYHTGVLEDLPSTLFGAGPFFLLSVVMALTAFMDLRNRKQTAPVPDDGPQPAPAATE